MHFFSLVSSSLSKPSNGLSASSRLYTARDYRWLSSIGFSFKLQFLCVELDKACISITIARCVNWLVLTATDAVAETLTFAQVHSLHFLCCCGNVLIALTG
jgi:hypothetical protein